MTALRNSRSKPLFQHGPTLGMRLFLLAFLSISLMVLDHRQKHLDRIRDVLSYAVYPVRALVDLPFSLSSWAGRNLEERTALIEENERLQREHLENSARLQRLAALEAENKRLRELMQSSARVRNRVLVAEIMAVDLDPYRQKIIINKGERDKVFAGQALLDASGIVGQVTRTDPLSAEALLISDASHALPVEVNRNGLRSIAVGTGDISALSLPFLPNNADIREGDLLVSSGLGGTFPRGYPVALVTNVARDLGEPFARVMAEPSAALGSIREVLLVFPGAADTNGEDDAPEPQRPESP